jgi:hypothetical protein
MSFPEFADIDKAVKDLLKKDFFNAKKPAYTLKTKNTGPWGTKINATIDYLANGTLGSSLSTEFAAGGGFKVDKFEMAGKDGTITMETSLEGGSVPPGLKLEFKGNTVSETNLGATYETDALTATAVVDAASVSSASVSLCTGQGPATVGVAADLSFGPGSKGFSVDDYQVGASYSQPKAWFAGVTVSNKLTKADVTVGYEAAPNLSLAALLNFPGNVAAVGGAYKCNPDTSVKIKAGTDGILSASVKQCLGSKTTAVGMAQFDSNKSCKDAFSVGGNITLG